MSRCYHMPLTFTLYPASIQKPIIHLTHCMNAMTGCDVRVRRGWEGGRTEMKKKTTISIEF